MRARGWDVSLFSSAYASRPGTAVERGVRTVRLRAWNELETRFGVPFPVFTPWMVVAMAREVRRTDVVHVHDPLYLTSWAAALWCLLLRKPYVVHRHVGFVHHSSFVVRLVQSVVRATLARAVLAGAAAILPIDEAIASDSVPHQDRVHVLGNGVDTLRFQPPDDQEELRRELGLPQGRVLVLFVGRFVPKKGFAHVAAAASDEYDLVFVGGDRPPGVDDPRLHFLGGLPAERMPSVYAAADVMVVASVGECPLTVLEAMASGLPVVANDDPALHTPWTVGPGVEFTAMADGGLRPLLERLVVDQEALRSRGAAARAYVVERFSWDAHLDALESHYRDVLISGGLRPE